MKQFKGETNQIRDRKINRGATVSIARVVEITATSEKSFEDAIQQAVARAGKTLRQIKSAWVKEQEVRIENQKVVGYKVNLMVTFVLEEL